MNKDPKSIKIGNMCCARCILAVKQVFDQAGVKYKKVELGSVLLLSPAGNKLKSIEEELKKAGFEIITSKEDDLTEKIKIALNKIFFEHPITDFSGFNLKAYLEEEIKLPYKKMAEVYSKHSKRTIENSFILHRIEKVKTLIDEDRYSFSEIALKLGFNSLSHLSRQFKAHVGVSMQNYRSKPNNKRKFIDKI